MSELELKEQEYMDYIEEHIANVKSAFYKYGNTLCEKLNISKFELEKNIYKHDLSKFSEDEFDAYRNYFFPCNGEERNDKAFELAWEHHYKNNPHHPEYWIHNNQIEDMPNIYIAEMLCDWEAMSMKFKNNTYDYYIKERNKKPFSEHTKKVLDDIVEIFK